MVWFESVSSSAGVPRQVISRASAPLMTPDLAYQTGGAPFTCNVPNVVSVEAAHATATPDVFRVYFGGADATVGTAVVTVTSTV